MDKLEAKELELIRAIKAHEPRARLRELQAELLPLKLQAMSSKADEYEAQPKPRAKRGKRSKRDA